MFKNATDFLILLFSPAAKSKDHVEIILHVLQSIFS